jgi:ketosteroid isomerase-like protein
MSDAVAVLFANEAFYQAFADRDLAAMDSVWSREAPVTCIHPGWNLLSGREAVIDSWQAILGDADAPAITCHNPSVQVFGDLAYILCHESLGHGFLIATNIFIRENGPWRMIHHHAAPAPAPVAPQAPEPSGPLQ